MKVNIYKEPIPTGLLSEHSRGTNLKFFSVRTIFPSLVLRK
jgi:hypothetical protein